MTFSIEFKKMDTILTRKKQQSSNASTKSAQSWSLDRDRVVHISIQILFHFKIRVKNTELKI